MKPRSLVFGLCVMQALAVRSMGRPTFDVPTAAKPYETTARRELETYLFRAVKGPLTLVGETGVVFHVGDTDFAKTRGLGSASFADEEWSYRSFGRDVVLNGGGTRGCLYAVSHFLEEQLGVRWWAPDDEDVPEVERLDLPALDRRGRPALAWREIYVGAKCDERIFVRNRLNSRGISAAWGGGRVWGPPAHCHTWDPTVPFDRYGAGHPEFFSLVNGKRIGGQRSGQLCLTAPGLVDFYAARLEEFIAQGEAAAKKAGLRSPTLYDISQNDNDKFCQCADCRREWETYGSSGYQLRFVNAVAERVGKRHPELLFSTLAYVTGEDVPKGGVRAASNVVVRLCNTRQNMAAGIHEEGGGPMGGLVRQWKDYASALMIWEYAITYDTASRGYPFPSEYHIFEKFRHYADNGVIGIFIEHESPDCADFYPFKFHLEARALEDPNVDSEKVMADFYRRYFGPAAEKVAGARRMLERIRRERKAFIGMYESVLGFGFVRDGDAAEMQRLYDEAEATVASDAKRLRRVREARASIDRLAAYRQRFAVPHVPEEGVCDKPFYDFPFRRNDVWNMPRAFRVVESPQSPAGLAEEIDPSKSELFRLPFAFGVYDTVAKKLIGEKRIETPSVWNEYAWYELPGVTMPAKNPFYVYLTRSWSIQVSLAAPAFAGRTFDVRVHLNFTGSAEKPDGIYVDRLILVPLQRVER